MWLTDVLNSISDADDATFRRLLAQKNKEDIQKYEYVPIINMFLNNITTTMPWLITKDDFFRITPETDKPDQFKTREEKWEDLQNSNRKHAIKYNKLVPMLRNFFIYFKPSDMEFTERDIKLNVANPKYKRDAEELIGKLNKEVVLAHFSKLPLPADVRRVIFEKYVGMGGKKKQTRSRKSKTMRRRKM